MRKLINTHQYILAIGLCSVLNGPAWSTEPVKDPTRPWNFSFENRVNNPDKNDDKSKDEKLSFSLSGITYQNSADKRGAIVNGKFMRLGDKIENARVDSIQRDKVTLNQDGNTIVLKLFDQNIKKSSSPK